MTNMFEHHKEVRTQVYGRHREGFIGYIWKFEPCSASAGVQCYEELYRWPLLES